MLSQEARDVLARDFPHLTYLLNIPGLSEFFETLANSDALSQAEFDDLWYSSDWFREHSYSERQFIVDLETDPASVAQDIERLANELERDAAVKGIEVGRDDLEIIAEQQLRWNLSDADVNAMLSGFIGPGVATSGTVADQASAIRSLASSYFLKISDGQALEWAKQIDAGNLSFDGLKNQFTEDARSLFPQFEKVFDRDLTLEQGTFAIRSHVGTMLQMSPESIDLTSPRFSHLIDFIDPTSGEKRVMTYSEMDEWTRGTSEFQRSAQGMAEGSDVANSFTQALGITS